MQEQIKKIKELTLEKVKDTKDLKLLNDVKVQILGKKGELTQVLRGMGALSPEERPKWVNL